MNRRHLLTGRAAGGLLLAFAIGAQPACRMETPDRAEADMEAQGTAGDPHWGYEGETGPDRWGQLDPSFELCDSGMAQSPIDLAEAGPGGADGLAISWEATEAQVVDNGHTIQVDVAEGSSITLEGRRFSLAQFHFHLPSEHTVEGASHAMELHFVHAAEEGDLAVIGVFLDGGEVGAGGEGHPAIQSVWDAAPAPGVAPMALGAFDPRTLLPEGGGYYRYAGSLTTPPCSEIVSWVVMTDAVSVSRDQIDAFASRYPMNARPVQPLHGRELRLHP